MLGHLAMIHYSLVQSKVVPLYMPLQVCSICGQRRWTVDILYVLFFVDYTKAFDRMDHTLYMLQAQSETRHYA